jgi:hypothetical protein
MGMNEERYRFLLLWAINKTKVLSSQNPEFLLYCP